MYSLWFIPTRSEPTMNLSLSTSTEFYLWSKTPHIAFERRWEKDRKTIHKKWFCPFQPPSHPLCLLALHRYLVHRGLIKMFGTSILTHVTVIRKLRYRS
uniref:Ovule protein n=1 Tax=Steinernema glaseri TaxID=37863 RepID=A0A1I7ZH09_9BILA